MRHQVVAFRWLDAVSGHGWKQKAKAEADPCVCVGVVVDRTDTAITVAAATSENRKGKLASNARMTVPLAWIDGRIVVIGEVEGNAFQLAGPL